MNTTDDSNKYPHGYQIIRVGGQVADDFPDSEWCFGWLDAAWNKGDRTVIHLSGDCKQPNPASEC